MISALDSEMDEAKLCFSEPRIHNALKAIRKLNGSSQPFLVSADDGELYVVKFREFTGRRGIMAEAVGTELMRSVGLPVSEWAPIRFTDAFLDQHRELWYGSNGAGSGIRPRAGVHFGSQLVRAPSGEAAYEVIPSAWIDRVANRKDVVGALLLGLCANQCDRQQSLIVPVAADGTLRVVFIDHDHLFGGHYGDEKACVRRAMMRSLRWYTGIWGRDVAGYWANRIREIDSGLLKSIFQAVPSCWAGTADLADARNQLERRRERLDQYVEDISSVLLEGKCLAMSAGSCRCRQIVPGESIV